MCLLSICLRLECCLIYFFFSLSLFLVAEDEPDQLMERRVRSPAEPTRALQGETRKSNQFLFFFFFFLSCRLSLRWRPEEKWQPEGRWDFNKSLEKRKTKTWGYILKEKKNDYN